MKGDFTEVKRIIEPLEKAAIYLRVSTVEQDEETQLEPCEQLCKKHGWEVVGIYREKAGAWGAETLSKRPELRRLLKAARHKKFAHVVVWDLNRLFRNRKQLVETIRAYKQYGVQFNSVRNAWLDELNKAPEPWNEIITDLMVQIVGWMGEDESNMRSENTRRGIAQKKKRGEYSGGRPRVTLDVEEAQRLRDGGMSLRDLGKHFRVSRTTISRVTKKSKA